MHPMSQKLFRNEKLQIFIVALTTAIAGQFRVTPFIGDYFRIGLGTSTFLLFLLLLHNLPYLKTGLLTGVMVLGLRLSVDWLGALDGQETFSAFASLQTHFPALIFYVLFAFGMSRIQNRLNEFYPLILGAVITAIDFAANFSEFLIRRGMEAHPTIHFQSIIILLSVAVLRSYFIVGLYSSITINQMRSLEAEQRKRLNQMLQIGSGLYGETFYLKKSIDTIEQIAANGYDLYSQLKEEDQKECSLKALNITQQIHEVKKDSQRVLAGLLKLYDREIVAEMTLTEIVSFVVRSNRKYSQMLKKNITFLKSVNADLQTSHYIPLLTLLNNLAANAVEAIDKQGWVNIMVYAKGEFTVFSVSDSGKGIPERDFPIIFEPGFTTKFYEDGAASTGIGLSHARDIVWTYGGTIEVVLSGLGSGVRFVASIPTDRLKEG